MRIAILHHLAERGARHGTELVTQELAQSWHTLGCDVTLIGHARDGGRAGRDHFGEVPVIALPPLPPSRWLSFSMRSSSAPGLREALAPAEPDVAVVVGLGPQSIDLRHIEIIDALGIPCTLWHHVPGVTCQQYGLRYKNRELCDGEVKIGRCARCRLTAAGAPELLADLASILPFRGLENKVHGPLAHIVGARALSGEFYNYVKRLSQLIKLTFVGADWAREVLLRNGFAEDALALVRPGVRQDLARAIADQKRREAHDSEPLRLIFWGRLDDTKGVDTAILAVRSLSERAIRLTIVGSFDPAVRFQAHLGRLAAGDDRIRFAGRLEPQELAAALSEADVALIPSPWPETGPLTVFEARAARLPILGARTGGISELCQNDESARLFERNDHAALAELIRELAENRAEVRRRRALTPPARTMAQVAHEMLDLLKPLALDCRRKSRAQETSHA